MNRIISEDIERIIAEDINWDRLKGKTILLTGASGMLGSYIMSTLVVLNKTKGYNMKLYGLMRNPNKLSEEIRNEIEVIRQSVVDPIDTDVKFDYILHTASPASPLIMKDDPVGTIGANALGAWNTLKLAEKSNSSGYLFISSREIYGEPYENQTEFTEDVYGLVDPLQPRSSYPEGKKAAETMCVSFKQQYGLDTKIARLAHTFGPGMSIDDGRVQADFFRDVVNNRDIVLKSEGTAIRTYTYIADAVSAVFYILLNSPPDEVAYNISSEDSLVSIRELAEKMVEVNSDRNIKLVFSIPEDQAFAGTAPFKRGILNSRKLKGLGWSPKNTLAQGIKRTVEYLES